MGKKEDFEKVERIVSKSEFTQADLDELMEKVDADFREEGKRLLKEAKRRVSKS